MRSTCAASSPSSSTSRYFTPPAPAHASEHCSKRPGRGPAHRRNSRPPRPGVNERLHQNPPTNAAARRMRRCSARDCQRVSAAPTLRRRPRCYPGMERGFEAVKPSVLPDAGMDDQLQPPLALGRRGRRQLPRCGVLLVSPRVFRTLASMPASPLAISERPRSGPGSRPTMATLVDVPAVDPLEMTAPSTSLGVQLQRRSPGVVGGFVDGDWWSRSLELSIELPRLLAERYSAEYDVHRVEGRRTQEATSIGLGDTSGWRRGCMVVDPPANRSCDHTAGPGSRRTRR
jgi:hypothetical protein